jgi:hypothetical protein
VLGLLAPPLGDLLGPLLLALDALLDALVDPLSVLLDSLGSACPAAAARRPPCSRCRP